MAREKKSVHKIQMVDGKRKIIQQLLQEYDIQFAKDIQVALKDLLGGTIKKVMETEIEEHLGYQKSERSNTDDYRNGHKPKRINSSYGHHGYSDSTRSHIYVRAIDNQKTPEKYL